jgi:hypothetical protein
MGWFRTDRSLAESRISRLQTLRQRDRISTPRSRSTGTRRPHLPSPIECGLPADLRGPLGRGAQPRPPGRQDLLLRYRHYHPLDQDLRELLAAPAGLVLQPGLEHPAHPECLEHLEGPQAPARQDLPWGRPARDPFRKPQATTPRLSRQRVSSSQRPSRPPTLGARIYLGAKKNLPGATSGGSCCLQLCAGPDASVGRDVCRSAGHSSQTNFSDRPQPSHRKTMKSGLVSRVS